jgi:lipopolysaccharide biosynthesis protein
VHDLEPSEDSVSGLGSPGPSPASELRFLAFLLPQFHPIPENDAWWGPGFTDWTNVAKARPEFRGHRQPHLPADLGFYDLRLPEARAAQASMAASYGINAFCYYHYWFEGRRVLEKPFEAVLRSGEPDFPFCLCWANESWTRGWSGRDGEVLLRQGYSEHDDLIHIRSLAEAFSDSRYLKICGRPVFLVYRAASLPDPVRTTETWRQELVRLGVGDPYLCLVHSFDADRLDPQLLGFDAAVRFEPDWRGLRRQGNGSLVHRGFRRIFRPGSPYRANTIRDHPSAVAYSLQQAKSDYRLYPCVSPGFDNSPRRPNGGATVLLNSSPELYEAWLREVVRRFEPFGPEENLVFINAWNEWAEGNHLEPCQQWGRGYLEAHARVVADHRSDARDTFSVGVNRPTGSVGS